MNEPKTATACSEAELRKIKYKEFINNRNTLMKDKLMEMFYNHDELQDLLKTSPEIRSLFQGIQTIETDEECVELLALYLTSITLQTENLKGLLVKTVANSPSPISAYIRK